MNYDGDSRGLHGGTWSYEGDEDVVFTLDSVVLVPGIAVSGEVTWAADGSVTADLDVRAPRGERALIDLAWRRARSRGRRSRAGSPASALPRRCSPPSASLRLRHRADGVSARRIEHTTATPGHDHKRTPDERRRRERIVEQQRSQRNRRDRLEEREDPGDLGGHVPQDGGVGEGREPGEDDPECEHARPVRRGSVRQTSSTRRSTGERTSAPTTQSQNATVTGEVPSASRRFETTTSAAKVAAEPRPVATAANEKRLPSSPESATSAIPTAPTGSAASATRLVRSGSSIGANAARRIGAV